MATTNDLTLYLGAASDFVEPGMYGEFSEWISELAERVHLSDYPTDEQVDEAWVSTDRWGHGEHIFWSVLGPSEWDKDGFFPNPKGSSDIAAELVVTTMPPVAGNEDEVKTIVFSGAELTDNGMPRFLSLTHNSLCYYEVWLGKTFFWQCDSSSFKEADLEDEYYYSQDVGGVTWAAETRKEYLDSLGIKNKPWKLLEREKTEKFGCLVERCSPAHPDARAIARSPLLSWRTAVNRTRRAETLRRREQALVRAGGKRRTIPVRLGAPATEARRQPPAPAAAPAAAPRFCLHVAREEDMPSGHRINLDGPDGNVMSIMARLLRNYPGMRTTVEAMLSETYEQVVRTASMMLGKTTFFTRDRDLAERINRLRE